MMELERLVADINDILDSPNSALSEHVADVSASYFLACEQTNQRLRDAGKLLRDGFRSEAIEHCEVAPNLLDAVALLDSIDHESWRQVQVTHEMVAPPSLQLDLATELNEAYSQEAPLQTLLKKHRLLALARAPLAVRLDVLRLLAKKDPANTAWTEDLQAYETARIAELKLSLSKAIAADDFPAIQAVSDEIASHPWSVKPPQDMAQQLKSEFRRLESKYAAGRLAEIGPQLVSAHAEMDIDASRLLRQDWNQWFAKSGLPSTDR